MQKSSTALLIASASLGMSGISAADLPRCDKSVRLTHWGDPMYPPTHLPDGTVVVEFTVDVQGKVSGPKILESSNERLSAEALKEVVRWRFSPPKQACRQQVPIKWQLKD